MNEKERSMSAETTLVIEKAVGEAAWSPVDQRQVEVNTTLGEHPTRPTGRVSVPTLHELGVDPQGRSGFAIRGLRVDLPEQRPFGGQNTEFIFTQDQMDAHVGGYDAQDGIWCGLSAELEPLSFAVWVRAMLDRRGFDVRSFGDFHVHARSKDVGDGYVSWVYQISLRGMAPTKPLWQTMWHYEPHPDGSTCEPLAIEPVTGAVVTEVGEYGGEPEGAQAAAGVDEPDLDDEYEDSDPEIAYEQDMLDAANLVADDVHEFVEGEDGDVDEADAFESEFLFELDEDREPTSEELEQVEAEYFTDDDFAAWEHDPDEDFLREWHHGDASGLDDVDAGYAERDEPTLFDDEPEL